jgi:hypothetical protein
VDLERGTTASYLKWFYVDQVPNIVGVNISRLAAQWEDRINKGIEGMKKQSLKYIQDELATIEALVSKAQGQTEEIRRTIEELKKIMILLTGWKSVD